MKDAGSLFDEYAEAYEQALSNAIAVSGEGRGVFLAEGRVAWLARCCGSEGNAAHVVGISGAATARRRLDCWRPSKQNRQSEIDVSAKSLEIARKQLYNAADQI